MALIRTIFWFAIFIGATFAFTVLFEHGFTNYPANAEREFHTLTSWVRGDVKRKPDTSDQLP